jgi:hypothetical protein
MWRLRIMNDHDPAEREIREAARMLHRHHRHHHISDCFSALLAQRRKGREEGMREAAGMALEQADREIEAYTQDPGETDPGAKIILEGLALVVLAETIRSRADELEGESDDG